MATLSRQDRNGVRTAQNLERKYKLKTTKKEIINLQQTSSSQDRDLKQIITDIKQIISNLEKKVDKEEGKGLSSNDFTNELKEALENTVSSKHSHINKAVLDKITESSWNEVLEGIKIYTYNLEDYKADNITIVDGRFQIKNNRAIINAQIGIETEIEVGTDITIFKNLPIENGVYLFQLSNGICKLSNGNLVVNMHEVSNSLILNLVFDL